ncbi:hypothetical protein O0I10_000304 [Lichtheimia ornata]|uniref:C2 domain-containing protein n=1 Tax=Lichtheimia ornata TaxID=688661 RepID=A0AAD7Y5B6_9FUNG|nr:uncharacterized protein O0I10_000304 [Lichtheimia ornata]KAJ8664026.1 hypothetical protein O0I10_000304 [Lichtheimia ornata]
MLKTMAVNDLYVKLSYRNEEDGFTVCQTTVKKDDGSQAVWDEIFDFPDHVVELYVEVMDQTNGVDELVGFAAIPLHQHCHGIFTIFGIQGEVAGAVLMTFEYNIDIPEYQGLIVHRRSNFDEEHMVRVQELQQKAIAFDDAIQREQESLSRGIGVGDGASSFDKKLFETYKAVKDAEWEAQRAAYA